MANVAIVKSEGGPRCLELRNPVTAEVIDEIPVASAEQVRTMVSEARSAHRRWSALSVKERAKIVAGAMDVVLRRKDEIVATVKAETGKSYSDILTVEILAGLNTINHWCARASKQLAPELKPKNRGLVGALAKLQIHYRPLGVVGVITPWNGPFSVALNGIVQALLAGNGVVLKPSEVTPRSSEWAVRVLHEAGVPEDVLHLALGDGETGAALLDAGLDKVTFTGSVPTGRKVARACAEQLIPCTLELGGKDAMIVCADADIDRAANGAAFLGMFNTGQVCVGVERIYVVESVADAFEAKLAEVLEHVRYGDDRTAELGAIFTSSQMEIVRRQVSQALESGAEALVGDLEEMKEGPYFPATVLRNCDPALEIMKEETFGPVVTVTRVRDEDEAIALANDSRYGLTASVWTRDEKKGVAMALRLEAGSVCVNQHGTTPGMLDAPFSGAKESGLGSANGTYGLRNYAQALPIVIGRFGGRADATYPYSEASVNRLEQAVVKVFGNRFLRRLVAGRG